MTLLTVHRSLNVRDPQVLRAHLVRPPPHFLTNKGRRGKRRGKGLVQGQSGFPGGSVVKNPPANARDMGDTGSIPGSGRWPGGGSGNPTTEFLSGRSYGQRSLVSYSP